MYPYREIIISGNFPSESACSGYRALMNTLSTTGGETGRGVTPCPLGHGIHKPLNFENNRPGWLPPQGDLRPLRRIGNEWRNN